MLRRGVFGGIDAVGVGWWSAVRQVVAGVASRPHGPPDDGPGTTRPDWPGRSGRRWPGGGRGRGRRWGGRGGCRAGGLAGDQDPGHRPVTGQPATPSGANGPTQPTSPPTAARPWRLSSSPAPSAGAGPTSLGQPARPQGPGGPARPGHQPGVGRRCGHRRRWPGGPGVPGRPASSGRPRPPTAHPGPPCPPGSGPATGPAPLMVAFGLGLGAVRVGDQPQVSDQLAQPRRVQAPGHLHQDRFGLGGDRGGQLVGADGQHPGVGRRQLAVGQGGGRLGRGRGTRPGRSGHWWGRPRRPCGAGPAASWRWSRTEHPGRRRRPRGRPPQPARPATGLPAGPAAAAAQGPARPAPGRAGRPGPGRPSPPPPLPTARAPPQARPRPGDAPVVQPNLCSYPWRQPINPHQNTSTTMKFGDNFVRPRSATFPHQGLRGRWVVVACRSVEGTLMPGGCMGHNGQPPCQVPAWRPMASTNPSTRRDPQQASTPARCLPRPDSRATVPGGYTDPNHDAHRARCLHRGPNGAHRARAHPPTWARTPALHP
jgi:hypothetical protein